MSGNHYLTLARNPLDQLEQLLEKRPDQVVKPTGDEEYDHVLELFCNLANNQKTESMEDAEFKRFLLDIGVEHLPYRRLFLFGEGEITAYALLGGEYRLTSAGPLDAAEAKQIFATAQFNKWTPYLAVVKRSADALVRPAYDACEQDPLAAIRGVFSGLFERS